MANATSLWHNPGTEEDAVTGEIIPLTREIGTHLPALLATAASGALATAASAAPQPDIDCVRLRAAVLDFVLDVERRRRAGWHKVNMKKVAGLRALVGLPDSTEER